MRASRADLTKRRAEVGHMFDAVAQRYDLFNDLLSLGADRAWRRATVEAVDPRPGELVLDLAAGTGTSSEPFAQAGAEVIPTDLSLGMLRVGKRRLPSLPFVNADALALPYADATFDAVTISFGLRNVEDTLGGLRELRRVTRPGGRIVITEFSTPVWGPFRSLYHGYLRHGVPLMAKTSSNPPAYSYLGESILAWPDQAGLADLMAEAGWAAPGWRNMSGGIVAMHRGWAA
ncbi:MAG: demethylmenaquinone methyltransferase [Propionibacteriaceae bacterium]|nr:demethylmenaquinone methyltransferase [Propionibacteriaceae bacterium]